jgi:putative Mg2+ transporter-C (MgtC) family protein
MSQQGLSAWQFVARLALGAALGILIGFERQRRQSVAGIHTTSLVATGATLFAMIEPLLGSPAGQPRVLANIVTGVGFLAGGVILKEGTNVRGLNTAATIWATAAVGALAGVGLYPEAVLAAVVIVALNALLQPVINAMNRNSRSNKDAPTQYTLTVKCHPSTEPTVRAAIVEAAADSAFTLRSIGSTRDAGEGATIEAVLFQPMRDDPFIEALTARLSGQSGVDSVSWSAQEL